MASTRANRRRCPSVGILAGISLLAGLTGHAGLAAPVSPQLLFGALFAEVQQSGIFPDSKTFPDAVPREAPGRIMQDYARAHPDDPGGLRQFVSRHFELPATAQTPASNVAGVPLRAHIDGLWDSLVRETPSAPDYSSVLPLPYPYVVPGDRFREIYYWDSYFTMLGLADSGRQQLLEWMVRDFAFLIDTYGHIPNGARTYRRSGAQPLLGRRGPAT